jgi:hypothetical protein
MTAVFEVTTDWLQPKVVNGPVFEAWMPSVAEAPCCDIAP